MFFDHPNRSACNLTSAIAVFTHATIAAAPLESPPLSPDDALKTLRVPSGYTVELVAAEPAVLDPVAIDWDAHGRLWVVEMADYPSGMDGQGKSGGRIRLLEDPDGDGKYDKSTLFLDGLNFPTGVLAWKQGILITAAPEIIYAEDTNGDGKADVRKVMYSGFQEGNQQLRVNGLRWGLDNWIYCASGAHHGGYGQKTVIRSHTGKEFKLGSRDFKIRPETGDLVPLSGPSQYGRARDDWGNWFGVQNSYPIWHYVIEDPYLQRNPDVTYPSPKQLLTERNPKVYPAKQPQKRFHNFTQSGRFTSACSVEIYRDELMFNPGPTHVFTCEPFHNLVQHNLLSPQRYSFKLERTPTETEHDFFASTDRWCRPVQIRTAPDGTLWVVDMYRYMIEHPQWLPQSGKDELRPHYRAGDDRGRLWRIRPTQREPRQPPVLAKAGSEELFEALGHPNGHVRDTAQRLMVRRGGEYPQLDAHKTSAREVYSPTLRIHSAAVLDGLNQNNFLSAANFLRDPDPNVRRFALRLLERMEYKPRTLRAGLKHLAARMPGTHESILRQIQAEKYPHVRLQLALSLGHLKHPDFGKQLASMANGDMSDPHYRAAVLSSIPFHYETVVQSAMDNYGIDHPLFAELLRIGLRYPDALKPALDVLVTPGEAGYSPKQFAKLTAWLRASKGKPADLKIILPRVVSVIRRARAMTTDRNAEDGLRAAAFQLLGFEGDRVKSDLVLLANVLNPQTPVTIQKAAAAAVVANWRKAGAAKLTQRWPGLSPTIRTAILNEYLRHQDLTANLLTIIKSGRIAPSDLNPDQQQKLTGHRNGSIRKQAAALFAARVDDDRGKVVARFQTALKLTGNAARGKPLYDQACLVCHRTDQPTPVGPDLRSITDKSPPALLSAILDPNAAVDPQYLTHTIDLKDDSVLTGRIISESGNSLTLLTAEAKTRSIVRNQIAEQRSSKLSLMPEGLEAGLSPQQLADLIAYVRELK